MSNKLLEISIIKKAQLNIKDVVVKTSFYQNTRYSELFGCSVFLKREDLQQVRSFKIRGAYNKIYSLSNSQLKKGVVCSSAGNHAQGFALACKRLNTPGTVFMPTTTPGQKLLNPTIGLDLRSYLFESVSNTISYFIGLDIYNSLGIQEPRVDLNDIEIEGIPDENEYRITIGYSIPGLDIYNLSLNATLNKEGYVVV